MYARSHFKTPLPCLRTRLVREDDQKLVRAANFGSGHCADKRRSLELSSGKGREEATGGDPGCHGGGSIEGFI